MAKIVNSDGGGAAAPTFLFTQVAPLATWIVNHNLGFLPTVEVRSTGGSVIDVEVIHISVNQAQIFFSAPFAGSARFS